MSAEVVSHPAIEHPTHSRSSSKSRINPLFAPLESKGEREWRAEHEARKSAEKAARKSGQSTPKSGHQTPKSKPGSPRMSIELGHVTPMFSPLESDGERKVKAEIAAQKAARKSGQSTPKSGHQTPATVGSPRISMDVESQKSKAPILPLFSPLESEGERKWKVQHAAEKAARKSGQSTPKSGAVSPMAPASRRASVDAERGLKTPKTPRSRSPIRPMFSPLESQGERKWKEEQEKKRKEEKLSSGENSRRGSLVEKVRKSLDGMRRKSKDASHEEH
ncbi:hypothetical protein EX30DRAFT_74422 [Ascodesmis nigricans]|uniref:Uncharacterized protein n=1 Tax=Ascodesmis nigricans TaxID=341454 RepID=A0A4S2MTC2_9PEZI|nr:hypothetical protein EX30DRAFT_74422 [Ascodesmis nigricans]